MALDYDDIKMAASAMHPAQAMEVAKIAQLAAKDALDEGKAWDGQPVGGRLRSAAILNVTQANTSVLRKILSRAGAGFARGRIVHAGSSVELGAGALGGTLFASGGKQYSRPQQSARLLNARGLRANANYWVCDGGENNPLSPFDGRITQTGTVVNQATVTSIGGYPPAMPSNATHTYTAPAGTAFDTVDIAYIRTVAGGQVGVGVDGGTTQIQTLSTTNNPADLVFATVTVPAGSTAVTIKNTSAGTTYPVMIGLRTAASPGIEVINAGFASSGLTDASYGGQRKNWNSTLQSYGTVPGLLGIPQGVDTVFHLECILNDIQAPLADYIAGQTAFINRAKSVGEVYWRIPFPPQDGVGGLTLAAFNQYANAARDNAIALGCVVIDERLIASDYTVANGLGWMFDNLHENGGGYFASARVLDSLYASLI